jgi:small conductance mechanosensitive channel
MKLLALFILFGLLGAPSALAQTPAHAAAAAPAAVQPKPAISAIIPGSPLAALTGAGPPPAAVDANAPAPFGTSNLGLSFSGRIGADASRSVDDFLRAIRQSTRLTPFFSWAASVASDPDRRLEAAGVARGIAVTLLPALLAEAAVRLLLTRPRRFIAARAGRIVPLVPTPPTHPAGTEDDAAYDDASVAGIAAAEAGAMELPPRRRISILAWLRRLAFALLMLAFSLAGLAGFVLALQILVSAGLLTSRPARLAVIGLANAYLICRVLLELLRFLVAPKLPPLRLIRMPNFHALWLWRWVRLVLVSIAVGYALVSVCEILGLSKPGVTPMIYLIALIIHVEVAVAIWQSRHVVARWIAGQREPTSYIAGARHRLAAVWHYLALFYVLALWIAYAGGVHNAFIILLRAVLVFLAALLIGRAAWVGSALMLERLFPDSTSQVRHPAFIARARAYNPAVRALIRVIIGFAVAVLILQGWGIDAIGWLSRDQLSRALLAAFGSIIVTIAIALALWEAANALIAGRINGLTEAGRTRQASRLRTLLPMLKASIGVAIGLVAGLICLSKIGVNAAPLLAGAGVLGIAIGFGSQKLVQDIITGLFLLLEDAMQVGDVVSLAGMSGTVELLSIRTIRLRGDDGSVNIVPFSAVTTVTNKTRDFSYAQISIQIGYEEDLSRVYEVLNGIARSMRSEPPWDTMIRDDLQIFGLDEFAASALVVTGRIRTGPGQHWAVRRQFYARVKKRFAEVGIDMPYTYLAPAPPPAPPPSAAPDAARLPTEGEPPAH